MPNSPIDDAILTEIHAPIYVSLDATTQTVTLRRAVPQSPATVWSLLTDPARLAVWSPIVPDRALTTAGPATSRENPGDAPVDATVIEATEPSLLAHHWGVDTVTWHITPTEEGSLLELLQTCNPLEVASMYAAGWQVCIGRLAAEDGTPRERVVGERANAYGWAELNEKYRAAFTAS